MYICGDLSILNAFSDLFFACKSTISRHFAAYASVALETIWLHEPRDLIFLGPLMTLLCLSRYSSRAQFAFFLKIVYGHRSKPTFYDFKHPPIPINRYQYQKLIIIKFAFVVSRVQPKLHDAPWQKHQTDAKSIPTARITSRVYLGQMQRPGNVTNALSEC